MTELNNMFPVQLDQLGVNQRAEVIRVLDHPLQTRLMALGFTAGVKILLFKIFGGNQTYILQLPSQLIALRQEEAALIEVRSL